MSSVEYRVRYNAYSNISFHNDHAGWERWEGDEDMTPSEVEAELSNGKIVIPTGLEIALERSGFEWWVEARETES